MKNNTPPYAITVEQVLRIQHEILCTAANPWEMDETDMARRACFANGVNRMADAIVAMIDESDARPVNAQNQSWEVMRDG